MRIIFTEKEVAEEEEKEEETLPLFVVAGETKNRGWRVRGEEKMTDKGARGSCGRSFVDLDCEVFNRNTRRNIYLSLLR